MDPDRDKCRHENYMECVATGNDFGGQTRYVCMDCGGIFKNKCEVYSRVVGYLRPTSGWNPGKKEEFKERLVYDTPSNKQLKERKSDDK